MPVLPILVAALTLQHAALAPGAGLPAIEGESLSGRPLALPAAASGKVTLLVFTFSRKAGQAAAAWAQAFATMDAARDAASFRVLVLGGVPRILRGLVTAGIRRGMPASLHDTTLKLFTDEDAWRARLGVREDDDPHLVLLDRQSRVRWLYAGVCDEGSVRLLAEQLTLLAPESSPGATHTGRQAAETGAAAMQHQPVGCRTPAMVEWRFQGLRDEEHSEHDRGGRGHRVADRVRQHRTGAEQSP